MNSAAKDSDADTSGAGRCRIGRRVIVDATLHPISRELLGARMRAGLLQRQVAARMGTTTSAISRLESAASHRPTLTTLERDARAVGCSLDVRLVRPDEGWYRHLSTLAGEAVRQTHEVADRQGFAASAGIDRGSA